MRCKPWLSNKKGSTQKRNKSGVALPTPIRRTQKRWRIWACLRPGRNTTTNAIDYYRRALAINPDLPGLQMNLGLALFKAAQFPDAIKSFASEIRKHPGDQRLTILLGMAHYGMKDYLVAIPYLKRATEQRPPECRPAIGAGAQLPAEQAISVCSQCARGDSCAEARLCRGGHAGGRSPRSNGGQRRRDERIAGGRGCGPQSAERALWARLSLVDRGQVVRSG